MDYEITIWCSECNAEIDGKGEAFCVGCIEELHGEISELRDKVSELEGKIGDLGGLNGAN